MMRLNYSVVDYTGVNYLYYEYIQPTYDYEFKYIIIENKKDIKSD